MKRVLFDLSGLVQWYAYLSNPSGIQRVMENILGQPPMGGASEVTFAARALGSDTFYVIEPSLIQDLLRTDRRRLAIAGMRGLFGASMRLGQPSRLLKESRAIHLPYLGLGASFTEWLWASYWARGWMARRSLTAVRPGDGYDALVGLGDFWCHQGHVEGLIALKRRSGAKLVHLVHDLVAVLQPQWTHPHYGREFVAQLAHLAPHVDRWLATSGHVAGQLSHYLGDSGLAAPVDTIPMGWPPVAQRPPDLAADAAILQKHGLQRGRYLLHVGTVEPRKNLAALFDALADLPPQAAARDLPCILIGRDGWRSDAVRERLKSDARLAGRVRWIKDAPDGELGGLYRGARFTVVPSLDEGWGLAVQESLAHGTPCIASRVGGIPESSLGLATFVPANDVEALRDAISLFAEANGAVDEARRAIEKALANRSLPSWEETAAAVLRFAGNSGGSSQVGVDVCP